MRTARFAALTLALAWSSVVLTSLSPETIHEIGLKEVARIRAQMEEVMRRVKFKGTFEAFTEFLRKDPQFY